MKKLLIALILMAGVSAAHAMLSAGNIAVVMANSDAPDSFAWVPLVDLPAGLVINFTDSSYGSGDGSGITNTNFRYTEHLDSSGGGPLSWSHSSPLPAGTVVIFNGTTWNIGTSTGNAMNLSTAGDQIFVFTGAVTTNPAGGVYRGIIADLIFGIQFSGNPWLTSGLGSTSDSYLPPALAGANVALGANDNWVYNGPMSGTPEQLLAAITNPDNWRSDNSTAFTWTAGNFNVVPEPSTVALVVCGAAGMAWRRLHRRR